MVGGYVELNADVILGTVVFEVNPDVIAGLFEVECVDAHMDVTLVGAVDNNIGDVGN